MIIIGIMYPIIIGIGTIVDIIMCACDMGILIPSDIYENTKLNWFGSWFLYILFIICSPFTFILRLLVISVFFLIVGIKWLFTVGREEDDE